ncbi:MAG: hypothetical protein JXA81_12830 [Sedimentisphaerales bacterium]|nr:hypothetical protein [Sedimentisphaerales bacterium]
MTRPFTLLIKPSGSDCNIDCRYCFYKDRASEFGCGKQRMSNEVLENLVKDYMSRGFDVSGFDSLVTHYVMGKHTICTYSKQCGGFVVIEHTGDSFCCEFFVEPQ